MTLVASVQQRSLTTSVKSLDPSQVVAQATKMAQFLKGHFAK